MVQIKAMYCALCMLHHTTDIPHKQISKYESHVCNYVCVCILASNKLLKLFNKVEQPL